MQLENVYAQSYGGAKAIFRCAYDKDLTDEARSFQKATPCGHAEFTVDNPAAAEQLVIGKYYYVDFTSAEPDTGQTPTT